MKRHAHILILTLCILTAAGPAMAQSVSPGATLVPDDARFALVLNPSRVMQSQLGQTILNRIRVEEPQIDSVIDEFSNTVGIDLRTAVGQVILYGTGYDKRDFALVADIGPTSGNLNGLMLAAPGYESSVYRDEVIIHSLPDKHNPDSERIFCAMPKRPGTDSYYMVASFDPQRTRDMVDQTMDGNARLTPAEVSEDTLLEAWFNGLPELVRAAEAQGPPSAVAELIQSGHLALRETGDSVTADLRLTMTDGLRAQQVFELMRGGLAMLQLAAAAEPEAAPLAEIGRMINIQHDPDDTDVTATFNCSYDRLEQLIQQLEGMDQMNKGGKKAAEKHASYLLNLGTQINRDEVTKDEAWAKIRTKYGQVDDEGIRFIEYTLDLGGKVATGVIPRDVAIQNILHLMEQTGIELKD